MEPTKLHIGRRDGPNPAMFGVEILYIMCGKVPLKGISRHALSLLSGKPFLEWARSRTTC